MKNSTNRSGSNSNNAKRSSGKRILKQRSRLQADLSRAYPPVGTFPDVRLPSSAFKLPTQESPVTKASAQPKFPLTFEDHLEKIDLCKGKYRESIQQLLAAAYAACIAYDDKSETVKATNKAILEAKCAALKIEGKSHYQLITKHSLGDDAKRASGFVHVIKAAQNQKPSVPPDYFIAWLNNQGGIQAVRTKYNSDGTEKTTTTPSPPDTTAENIIKAKDSILDACMTKIPYGQLPEIAKLGNEADGLAILRQQADGSVVIKLVLNDSKMVDSIYAAHGRTLK